MSALRVVVWSAVVVACSAAAFFSGYYLKTEEEEPQRPPRITLITASPDDFHQAAVAGARAAAEEFKAELNILVPGDGAEQSSMLAGLDHDDVDGLVISPRDPRNQTRMLSRLAIDTHVVTYDNDAPSSLRQCYVGTDNYSGGKMAADLVRKALPEGGKLAIFIGDVERDNAQLRRLGLLDALLDRPRDEDRPSDPLDRSLTAKIGDEGELTIVGTYLDDHNEDRCGKNIERALEEHPDLKLLVGLYGYVAPVCVRKLEDLGKNDLKIVGFDHHDQTLAGIESGKVLGTVVQNPYEYGFDSVRMLSKWWKDPYAAPSAGALAPKLIECQLVEQDNLEAFRKKVASYAASDTAG